MVTISRIALLVGLVACGDPAPVEAPDASASAPDASIVTPDASEIADAGPLWACAVDGVVHLEVHPVVTGATIPDGRIIVDFYQLIDDLPVPQHVGYDRPFAGTTTGVDLALADVVLPAPIDDYRLCPRTCFDLSNPACDCPAAEPKLALAFVFVMRDVDGSGAIEPAELVEENLYGVGYLQLGESDQAYPVPNTLDGIAPEGIQGCLAPYSIIPATGNRIFDTLGIPPAGTSFPLDVCVPGDPSCSDIRFPNLT